MKKLLCLFGISVLLIQISTSAHAGQKIQGTLKNWIGHKQQDRVLNASKWIYCYRNDGGSCGWQRLTTGKSKCTSWTVGVGGDFTLKKIIPGLAITAGGSRTWTTCNTRSEAITCSPNRGYRGRAALLVTARYGVTRFRGAKTIQVNGKRNAAEARRACGKGYKTTKVWKYCAKFGCHWRARCTPANHDVKGMWPEKRWSMCQYRRL